MRNKAGLVAFASALATTVAAFGAAATAQSLGSVVVAATIANAFAAPPSGGLGERGAMVRTILPGAAFRLVERRVVDGVLGEEEWVRLEPEAETPEAPCAARECWIMNRRLGSAEAALQGASTL